MPFAFFYCWFKDLCNLDCLLWNFLIIFFIILHHLKILETYYTKSVSRTKILVLWRSGKDLLSLFFNSGLSALFPEVSMV